MSDLFNRLQDEINAQEQPGGLSPIDLLDLPDELSQIIRKIIRRNGMKLADVAEALAVSPDEARQTLESLVEKGFVRRVEVKNDIWYKARFAQKRSRTVSSSLWQALDEVVEPKDAPPAADTEDDS